MILCSMFFGWNERELTHLKVFFLFFIYLFSDSWLRGYVPETEIQGTMTSQFPSKFHSQPVLFYRRDGAN